jgi:hypothetical protein
MTQSSRVRRGTQRKKELTIPIRSAGAGAATRATEYTEKSKWVEE